MYLRLDGRKTAVTVKNRRMANAGDADPDCMESGGKRRRRGTSFWSNIDHPAVWLAYLPLFFIPWFFEFPSPAQIIGVIAGLIIFLGLYFAAIEAVGTRLVVLSVATLLLSFLLAFTASNWTVIAIYAAAMIANLRPARNAAV